MKDHDPNPVRIVVRASGVWRASQMSQALTAIDQICARVAIAVQIADLFEAYDWAVRSYGFFGFLGGAPSSWKKPRSPSDVTLRTALAEFVAAMRRVGVDVQPSQTGIKYALHVNDLLELVPVSSRLEIESIHMESPGAWTFVTLALTSNLAVRHVKRIFSAIVSPQDTRRKIRAEADSAEVDVEIKRAIARKRHLDADQKSLELPRRSIPVIQDLAVAVDSLVMSLVNAGLPPHEIQRVLVRSLEDNSGTIAVLCNQGLIRSIEAHPVRRRRRPKSQ